MGLDRAEYLVKLGDTSNNVPERNYREGRKGRQDGTYQAQREDRQ